jgi:phosphate transport system permease protein
VVPSIIFGLFGLGFFIKFIGVHLDNLFSPGELHWGQPNILWASLTMALLTLPIVIVSVEESIHTVSREVREASLALGATKWQTILKVVLPGSITGILTGTILAISRGAGEVAPILFTGAAYYLAELPRHPTDQFMSLGYHIYIMSTQSTNVDQTLPIQFATTLVLLLLTFSLSMVAVTLRYRIRKKAR